MRGLHLVNWGSMCHCSEEMIDHLLIHCEIAYTLWSELFMIFWIHWVLPDKVASLPFFLDGAIDSKSILQMCGIWCRRM